MVRRPTGPSLLRLAETLNAMDTTEAEMTRLYSRTDLPGWLRYRIRATALPLFRLLVRAGRR